MLNDTVPAAATGLPSAYQDPAVVFPNFGARRRPTDRAAELLANEAALNDVLVALNALLNDGGANG